MADPRLYLYDTPMYLLFNVTVTPYLFIEQYDTLAEATDAADAYIIANKVNLVAIVEASYGVLRKRAFADMQPPATTPQ